MPKYIEMPKLADTMTEGTVQKWCVKEGDKVSPGDVVAEVTTDKATMEMETFDGGTVHKLMVEVGQKVPCGTPIVLLLAKGEQAPDPSAPAPAAEKKAAPAAAPAASSEKSSQPAPRAASAIARASANDRVKASPLARKIASARGLNLSSLTGTGPGGRIIATDLDAAPARGQAAAPQPSALPIIPAMPAGPDDVVTPLSQIRKIIAKRLLASKTQIPHFYLSMEMDAGPLMKIRAELNKANEASGGPKLTVNDLVLKAVAVAVEKAPDVNSAYTEEAIIRYAGIHVSIAVAIDDGLVTPVIRDANKKSLKEISESVKDLATRAKARRLKPEEFSGGTITVSNLGAYGIEQFCAIINPPQAAILAVGAIVKKPVVVGDHIVVGQRMNITLSGDHRVVDGAVAATYLGELKKLIEQPSLMLM